MIEHTSKRTPRVTQLTKTKWISVILSYALFGYMTAVYASLMGASRNESIGSGLFAFISLILLLQLGLFLADYHISRANNSNDDNPA